MTRLLSVYLKLGLACKKIHCFVQYIPKCLNTFIQSAVNLGRQADGIPHSSVAAETMKLQANRSEGYQIKDRSRPTVMKYSNDEKAHSAKNSKMFERHNHIINQQYEVEVVQLAIGYREPIIVGFFVLQYAKQGMLELYYNFKNFMTLTSMKNLKGIPTLST